MKLDFLRSGSPECPLIRLYDFDTVEADRLMQVALRLAQYQNKVVALHTEQYVRAIGGCELTLREGEKDQGASELAELKFEWVLTKGGWLEVAGLIQPFCRGEASGYQWLTRTGKIAVLLSHDGQW
jgi:hypothetical protein